MKQTKFKKGDIVYWQELQGEFIDKFHNSDYPIRVRFTNDGRCYVDTPIVLSHTPYTLNGFSQNEVIEKDTLVWVRDFSDGMWNQRFYSHFKDGKHHCFKYQKTSKETEEIESWNFLETTNPLIK